MKVADQLSENMVCQHKGYNITLMHC